MKIYDMASAYPKILKNATYGKMAWILKNATYGKMTWAEACKRGARMFAVMSEMFRELGETLDKYEPLLKKVWETSSERSMSSVAREMKSSAIKVFHPFQGAKNQPPHVWERCSKCGLPGTSHITVPDLKTGVYEMLLDEEKWCNCFSNVFAADGSGLIHEESCLVIGYRNEKRQELLRNRT